MNISRTALAAIVAGSALVGMVSSAAVAGGWGRHHIDPEQAHEFLTSRVDDVLDDLEASEDQRTRIHDVKDGLFAEGLALRTRGREGRDVIIEQMLSDSPDAKLMHAEVDAVIDDLRAFAHNAVDGLVEVHGTLSAEQRAALLEEYDWLVERWREQRATK